MARGTVNKVILLGRLGKDPEVRMTAGDRKLAKVTIATNESYKQNGELQTITDWHSLVFWGNQAEFAEKYLKKGMLIFVEGKLRTRKWQAQDGSNRYTTEVIVDSVQIVSGGQPREESAFTENAATEPDVAGPEMEPMDDIPGEADEDIPF
jgi:single-strand DNA-binding protein